METILSCGVDKKKMRVYAVNVAWAICRGEIAPIQIPTTRYKTKHKLKNKRARTEEASTVVITQQETSNVQR